MARSTDDARGIALPQMEMIARQNADGRGALSVCLLKHGVERGATSRMLCAMAFWGCR